MDNFVKFEDDLIMNDDLLSKAINFNNSLA